jgi:ribonuclease-3
LDRSLESHLQAGPLIRASSSSVSGRSADLATLEANLGYVFRDRHLLTLALTHVGAASGRQATYQRLEFLGDRVLGLCVSAMLYEAFPEADEGQLSRRLADLVRRETCAEVALAWDVEPYIRLGAGEKGIAALKQAILGDICESIIGAVFLDGGYEATADLVRRGFEERMRKPGRPLRDPKTMLQEWAQARALPAPVYRELTRSGPDHAPEFTVAVDVAGHASQEAKGPSKRFAEQSAAAAFIKRENITSPS